MIGGLIFILILGLILTIGGYHILFVKGGLDWMYKNKIWREKDNVLTKEQSRNYDRYINGLGVFLIGFIILAGSLIAFYFELFR